MEKKESEMKTKLLELELPEKLVNEILEVFDIYTQTLRRHDKPKGRIAFDENMQEIESQAKKLKKKLGKLTTFEKQILTYHYAPDTFQLSLALGRLVLATEKAKKEKLKFSQKRPFLLNLGLEIRQLLEINNIQVTKYRENIFCKILDVFFAEPEGSETSFNLLREVFNSNIPA